MCVDRNNFCCCCCSRSIITNVWNCGTVRNLFFRLPSSYFRFSFLANVIGTTFFGFSVSVVVAATNTTIMSSAMTNFLAHLFSRSFSLRLNISFECSTFCNCVELEKKIEEETKQTVIKLHGPCWIDVFIWIRWHLCDKIKSRDGSISMHFGMETLLNINFLLIKFLIGNLESTDSLTDSMYDVLCITYFQ